MEKLIEFKNVSLIYNKKDMVLDHISFCIYKGEIISIIGPNGCGKSTIARLILKLIEPTEGEIYFKDKLYKDSDIDIRKNFGMVLQNPDNQFIGNTVEDDVAFGLENKCVKSNQMQQIIDEKLKLVNMLEYKKFQPINLSGGQKQRVAIASNLAINLSLIIFDESTSMLDPKGKEEVLSIIKKIKEENKDMTIILITHNMEEVLLTSRVIAINNNKIQYDGKPDLLFKNFELINKLNLDLPFKYEIVTKLKKSGFAVDFNNSLKEIGDKLCQLK